MNISPVEIDNVLMASELVVEAAAVGIADPIYGEEVVCAVVPKSPGSFTPEMIIEHCQKHLPLAKVLKQVHVCAALPKNDRGKVLRDKLRDLLTAGAA